MSSQKIVGGEGFNEGGATVFTTVTGEATDAANPALNREELPRDYYMYGITESAQINTAVATDVIRAGIPGRQIEVLSYAFVADAATTVTFEDTNAADLAGPFPVAANGGVSADGGGDELFTTPKGEGLSVSNTAGNIGGHITYRII